MCPIICWSIVYVYHYHVRLIFGILRALSTPFYPSRLGIKPLEGNQSIYNHQATVYNRHSCCNLLCRAVMSHPAAKFINSLTVSILKTLESPLKRPLKPPESHTQKKWRSYMIFSIFTKRESSLTSRLKWGFQLSYQKNKTKKKNRLRSPTFFLMSPNIN